MVAVRTDTVWYDATALHRLGDVSRPEDPAERQFVRDLGVAIRATRLLADVSQEQLAEAAHATVGTLGRWERGVNAPKSYQLALIWRVVGRPDAKRFLDPADSMSQADREMAEIAGAVEEGRLAAYRPRRRATRRAAVERGVQRLRPPKPGQSKRKPGSP